jgi:hypothetical protein
MEFARDMSWVFNARIPAEKVIILSITIIEGKAEGRTIGN